MKFENLSQIARYIVKDGKGILAADESNPTCKKRFDTISVECTETNRRDYRELLFSAEGMEGNIGGVILFDETIRQNSKNGASLVDLILRKKSLPGIKVDQGLKPFQESDYETITQGLDGLDSRCKEYEKLGAKFTKWRAVITIGKDGPSQQCIDANMSALAKYAKIVQNNNLVPIVEPEVIMQGDHSIEDCYDATEKSLQLLFKHLEQEGVLIEGVLLKPNMVTSGSEAAEQAPPETVADLTIKCLKNNVPDELPGITFLSGGQTEFESTQNLDLMNKIGDFPWKLSFSYGRALQQSALNTWLGQDKNVANAQVAFSHRAKMNKLAAQGAWSQDLEN